jgi:hypothetical protein
MANPEPTLEGAYVKLWRRLHELSVELKRGADNRSVRQKLEEALDESLVDYTHWRVARVPPWPRDS